MSRTRGAIVGLCFALVTLTAAGTAASAVRIKKIDLGKYPTVRVTVLMSKDAVAAPKLVENGKRAPYLDVSRKQAKSVVLAIDRSHSMESGVLESATSAAREFVAAKPRLDRVALYTFGSKALPLTGFAADTIDVDSGLRALSVDGGQGTRLYDSVVLASLALQHQPKPRILILLTDGRDVDSRSSLADAVNAAQDAGVSVYAIGTAGPQLTPRPLKTLARRTGGTYYPAEGTRAFLSSTYERIAAELRRTWTLEYLTSRRPGEALRLTVSAGKLGTAKQALRIPTSEAGTTTRGSWLGEFRSHWWGALLIGVLFGLVLLGAAWLAFAKPRQEWLRERLEPWEDDVTQPAAQEEGQRMKALAPLVAATDTHLGDTRLGQKLGRVLEQAGEPLRPAHLFLTSIGAALGLCLIAAVAGASPVVIVLLTAAGLLGPYYYFQRKAAKRLQAFETQLPGALHTMAGSLKAGHSFRQAMQTIVEEAEPPIDVEFSRVLAEARLGRPIESALDEMGRRMGSTELDFALRAVIVQQQVGGSIAGLFELLAETLTQRQQFRQKVRSLTAQGRLTALLLIGLPFVIAFLISLVSPGYLDPLLHTGTGQFLIVLGVIMMSIGALALRRITSFRGYR